MRAALIDGPDTGPRIRDIPIPEPGPNEELIALSAAALNPHDQVVAAGINFARPYPYVTGGEGVGQTRAGRRVYVGQQRPPHGTMAEYTVATAERIIPIPDELSDAQALSIGNAGTTGWLALTWKGQLEAGQSVLVTAATGAVGQVAVQAAKVLGAGRVVAAGRNRQALDLLRARGADEAIVIDDEFEQNLAVTAGEGFDLVLDGLYGDYVGPLVRATRAGGRVVNFGMRAGRSATISGLELKGRDLMMFAATLAGPRRIREAYERMVDLVLDGAMTVQTRQLALEDIATAWQLQSDSPNAKLVLTV